MKQTILISKNIKKWVVFKLRFLAKRVLKRMLLFSKTLKVLFKKVTK